MLYKMLDIHRVIPERHPVLLSHGKTAVKSPSATTQCACLFPPPPSAAFDHHRITDLFCLKLSSLAHLIGGRLPGMTGTLARLIVF